MTQASNQARTTGQTDSALCVKPHPSSCLSKEVCVVRVALMIRYAGRCCCACVVWPRCPPTSKRRARFSKRLVQLGGAQERVGQAAAAPRRRRPCGDRTAAAGGRRPPPNSETGHVDRPGRCPRRRIAGLTSNLGTWHAQRSCYRAPPPRKKKGPSQGSTGSHCRFAQLLSIASFLIR